MYHFRASQGNERSFDDVTIRNLIAGPAHSLSLASARLRGTHPASVSSLSDRAYFIVDGAARFNVGSESFDVEQGDAVYVPRTTQHSMVGDMDYVVVNVPPFDPSAEKSG